MIVTLNKEGVETSYIISWKHRHPSVTRKMSNLSEKVIDHGGTSYYIYKITGPKPEEKELISSAELNVYYKDQFNKEVGRKLSLNAALRKLTEFDIDYVQNSSGFFCMKIFETGPFTKEDRRIIWNAYLAQKSSKRPFKSPQAKGEPSPVESTKEDQNAAIKA